MTRMDVSLPNDPEADDYWSDEVIGQLVGQTPVLTDGTAPVAGTRIVAARREGDAIVVTLEVDDRILDTPYADLTRVGAGYTHAVRLYELFPQGAHPPECVECGAPDNTGMGLCSRCGLYA
jgi:hypothetical protein